MGNVIPGDVRRAFVGRHVDMLAASTRRSVIERHRNAKGAISRCHAVGELARRLERRFAPFTGEVQQIAERDTGDVIGFVIAPWTRSTKRSDRSHDETRIDGAQLRVSSAQLCLRVPAHRFQ